MPATVGLEERKREAFKYSRLSGPKRHYAAMSLIIARALFGGNIATSTAAVVGLVNVSAQRKEGILRNDVFYFAFSVQ